MNKYILLFFLMFFYCLSSSNAKDNNNVFVSLNKKVGTVEYFISCIDNTEGVNLSYNSNDINLNEIVKVSKSRYRVKHLLRIILKSQNIEIINVNGYLILRKKRVVSKMITISGFVNSLLSGESLIGANVYHRYSYKGTTTNQYGFYTLTIPQNSEIVVSYLGYITELNIITSKKNFQKNFDLLENKNMMPEVVVNYQKLDANITSTLTGVSKISGKRLNSIPSILGVSNIVSVLKQLPGVQSCGEIGGSISVRGGSKDHNLYLFDEATIYNVSHMFGIFSAFNGDIIKNVDFYKGAMPARYGGRLASVVDIKMKEGSNKKIQISGGLGVLFSKLTVEGPIVKDRASFIVSGRRTYFDLISKLSGDDDMGNYYFYDVNAKVNYKINSKNQLFFSMFIGDDHMRFPNSMGAFGWGNYSGTLRWNHIINDNIFTNMSLVRSRYDYHIKLDNNEDQVGGIDIDFKWKSQIITTKLKYEFSHYYNEFNTFRYGLDFKYHMSTPAVMDGENENVSFGLDLNTLNSAETFFYFSNGQKISNTLSLEYGLRFGVFSNIGRATQLVYNSDYVVVDTLQHKKYDIYNSYYGVEPRISLTYLLSKSSSLKTSFNETSQYMQVASNSKVGTPFDVWIPATPQIKPQKSRQLSLGYFHNFLNNSIETSVETYYKWMTNVVDFKDHANTILNSNIEGELRNGVGRSYGIELFVKKKTGRLNGWLSYTLSNSFRTIEGIENEQEFRSPYDRPHNLSMNVDYQLTKKFSVGASFLWRSGMPFTSPVGKYYYKGVPVPIFGKRNADRLPYYHRLDLNMNYKMSKIFGGRFQSVWNISVYNVYGKNNTSNVVFVPASNKDNSYQTESRYYSVTPLVFSLTYKFKFL